MRELFLLIRVQILSALSSNFGSGNGKRKKGRVWLTVLGLALLFTYCSLMVTWSFVSSLKQIAGSEGLYFLTLFTAIMIITMGLTASAGMLYGFKDYDLLMSLPLKPGTIIASKLVSYYMLCLFYTIMLLLPGSIMIGIYTHQGFFFYLFAILGTVFVPVVPMVLSSLIGHFVRRVTAGMKHRTLVTNLMFFVFFGAYMYFMMTFSTGGDPAVVTEGIKKFMVWLPSLNWYVTAALKPSLIDFVLCVLINAAAAVLFVVFFSRSALKVNSALLSTTYHEKNFRLKEAKGKSVFLTLLGKEVRRFLSNSMYLLNMGIGEVMLVGMAVWFFFSFRNNVLLIGFLAQARAQKEIYDLVGLAAMAVLSFMAGMSPVASVSVSLEGKNLWILKSLPIRIRDIFLSKMAVNFLIILVPSVIAWAIFAWVLYIPLRIVLEVFVYIVLLAAFISEMGLAVNLIFPKLDFDREAVVIKRSLSVFVAMASGFVIPVTLLLFFGYVLYDTVTLEMMMHLLTGLALLADLGLAWYLATRGAARFRKLAVQG